MSGPGEFHDEREALEMVAGRRPVQWSAVLSACLEDLAERGLVTPSPRYQLTIAGANAIGGLRNNETAVDQAPRAALD